MIANQLATPMSQAQVEPINEEYEWIQYNSQMRIIHSIKDDYYQMQSILTACGTTKKCNDWFRNQSTQEMIAELEGTGNPVPYEKRMNVQPSLQGYYISKLLVNHVAIWGSPKYSVYIMMLLDSVFERERNNQQQVIEEQVHTINDLTSRAVPNNHKNDYRYLIYKETIE